MSGDLDSEQNVKLDSVQQILISQVARFGDTLNISVVEEIEILHFLNGDKNENHYWEQRA